MTVQADIKAITLTTNAIAAGEAFGTNLPELMTAAVTAANELTRLMKQIIAIHPAGDANLTALNNIVAELA